MLKTGKKIVNVEKMGKFMFRLLIKFCIGFTIGMLWCKCAYGQIIYQTENRFEADYIVYVTTNQFEADWIVYMTTNRFEAKKGIFYVTKNRFEADYILYVTTNRFEADRLIYRTPNRFAIKFKNKKL